MRSPSEDPLSASKTQDLDTNLAIACGGKTFLVNRSVACRVSAALQDACSNDFHVSNARTPPRILI